MIIPNRSCLFMPIQAFSSPSKPYFDYIVTMVSSGECQRYTRAVIQIPPRLSNVSYNVHKGFNSFLNQCFFSLYIFSIFLLFINLDTYRNTAKPYMGIIVFELFLTSMVFEAVRSLKTQISVHPTVCATSSILELYIMTKKTGLSTNFSITKAGKKIIRNYSNPL